MLPPMPTTTPPPTCPAQIEQIVPQMLKDLPSYANRVIQRQRPQRPPKPSPGASSQTPNPTSPNPASPSTYIVITGTPEIAPFQPSTPLQPNNEPLYQVFFTTLERQYTRNQITPLQQFHWLLLTPSPQGWQFVGLRSQLAPYPSQGRLLSPPRNSDQGAIAQGLQLWLRDCRSRNAR